MPLPQEPTRPLTPTKSSKAGTKADKELLLKAVLCVLIGLGVLVSPYFITSPGMQGIVAQSSLVGWFPDGHPKLPHLWPVKLPQARRPDYDGSGLMARRAAASLRR